VNSNTALLGSGTPNDFENLIGLVTQFTVTAVPEPAINLFLGAVLLALAGMILRRRSQA
jgi:MYXO-CTERM domain-containing protein